MTTAKPKVCIFAGSSMPTDPAIVATAKKTGAAIAAAGFDVVYGGGSAGVMGIVARAALDAGAQVTAYTVIDWADVPEFDGVDVRIVQTEAERFARFSAEEPVAWITLPGGPGTLREAMQGLESAIYKNGPPVVLVEVGAYLDGIKTYFDLSVQAGLIQAAKKDSLKVWNPDQNLRDVLPGDVVRSEIKIELASAA